ncbi:major facilitator superfamily domain-containing protein [Biscogniauxia sp. FL1348]|nr:major facilitator superfamily domain-containing protein [Biscogniauxia sp. FL1348]
MPTPEIYLHMYHFVFTTMPDVTQTFRWVYKEFGIASVYHTGRDAWLIIFSRACRMFAYGAAALIIALFFAALDFSDYYIGLFMTLTLIGDMLLSLGLTLVADRVGRRRVLLAGATLMVLSGAVFIYFENFWVLLLAAVIGVISATGSDFGPFRAVEESTLSHLTTPKTRSDVLSWYVGISILGSAAGTEASGRVVEFLRSRDGWELIDAYHGIFWLYVIMGLLNVLSVLLMSKKCELVDEKPRTEESEMLLDEARESNEAPGRASEESSNNSRSGSDPKPPITEKKKPSRLAQISAATRSTMYKLWFLLAVDSLADGMVSFSLTNYYLDRKFHVSKSFLGDVASISYFFSFLSTILASPLARSIGLIKTMVFTHLPSSTAVVLFPFPSSVSLTVVLLFIRMALNNMDQAPRAAFIAAVVKPEERTAVNGITSTLRTLAATIGPSVTGILAGNDRFWIAFVVAGALRIAYDLGLFVMFVNMKLHVHEPNDQSGREPRRASDEEDVADAEPLERLHPSSVPQR